MYPLRPALRVSFRRFPRRPDLPGTTLRCFATETTAETSTKASSRSFIPPDFRKAIQRLPTLPHPSSPTYFSGKSSYLDHLYALEKSLNKYNRTLQLLHVTPLPRAAKHHVGHVPSYWRDIRGMYQILGKGIKQTQYIRLIGVLNQLNRLRHLAVIAERTDIAEEIEGVIAKYEKPDKKVIEGRRKDGGRKKPVIDEYGRVYALGRRKTSSARVWVIPIQKQNAEGGEFQVAQMLVNAIPASQYFVHMQDRERVFRPLKLTGLLTSYNVFCLVRGGGTTGQAEAISMGLSRALAVLEPGATPIIKQGKLTRRDPRMVERKKTNLAKARKAYAWVKR